jgi:hypothetical protein
MMKMRFVLAVLLAAACKPKAPPPPSIIPGVVEVRVTSRTPDEAGLPPLDLAELTATAARTIGASGLPVVDGGVGPGKLKLRVEVRLDGAEDAASGKGVMRAFVVAKLTPVGEGLPFEQAAVAERMYEIKTRGDATAAWRAHAHRAVEDVVRGVGARARLARGDAAGIVAALSGSDEDLRDEAMRVAGERRERAAVPQLIVLLKSEDRAVRDRALGALASIGDPRAVRPLTEVAHFRDVTELPKVLDALSAIGGDEARAYLEFVASGHENPEMRELAKTALSHLERRQRDASTTK